MAKGWRGKPQARRLTIVDLRLLIFDVSLRKSPRTAQAHFNNWKSTFSNHQSIRSGMPDPET
jgi:hypothetical protein